MTIEEKIASKYKINPDTGCWEWTAGLNRPNGYARLTIGGRKTKKSILVHKYLYEKRFGVVEGDKELDHLCQNKKCINPDHLEPVSHTLNVHRGKGTGGYKVNVDQVKEIRALYRDGMLTQQEIGDRFSISQQHVSDIVNRVRRYLV